MRNFYFRGSLFIVILTLCKASLYNESDPIVQLNVTTFKSTISNNFNAWIVEFYNSWCGHCVNFAPTWKSLAIDVLAWKSVISVAAVDCVEDANIPLCREHNVNRFPTIQFFKPKASEKDVDLPKENRVSVAKLREGMIDFLESIKWPNLNSTKNLNLPELYNNLPSNTELVAVIVEKSDSYLGREVMLDLFDESKIKVFRVLNEETELLKSLNVSTVPALVTIKRDSTTRHKSSSLNSHIIATKFIKQSLSNQIKDTDSADETEDGAGHQPLENNQQNEKDKIISLTDKVYMLDLENAIYTSLFQELSLHESFSGEKLKALKTFVNILVEDFPGRSTVRNYLRSLKQWLDPLNKFYYKDFTEFHQNARSQNSYLPPTTQYKSCLSSKPGLRGYPCSLWLLFHVLTVENYNSRNKVSNFDPRKVPEAIAGYVTNFFSCEECSQHFQEMASKMKEEIKQPPDGVLWFWRAHNKVNGRTRGSATEDPLHPKVQFPTAKLCPTCQTKDKIDPGKWNEDEVLAFLLRWYSRSSIDTNGVSDVISTGESPAVIPNALQQNELKVDVRRESVVGLKSKRPVQSSWGFSALDMSLCLVLYLCSAVILLVVYFVIIVKRRLRKKNYQKVYLNFI